MIFAASLIPHHHALGSPALVNIRYPKHMLTYKSTALILKTRPFVYYTIKISFCYKLSVETFESLLKLTFNKPIPFPPVIFFNSADQTDMCL